MRSTMSWHIRSAVTLLLVTACGGAHALEWRGSESCEAEVWLESTSSSHL